MQNLIVVSRLEDLPGPIEGADVVTARSYLTDPDYTRVKDLRVYNLCRSYRYQSAGYYVSLLAEARGHSILPGVATLQDFRSISVIKSMSEDLEYLIQKGLKRLQGDEFTLSIYFGQNLAKQYEALARAIYGLFEAPLLRVHFTRTKRGWEIQSVGPVSLKEIPENHRDSLLAFAQAFFKRRAVVRRSKKQPKYSLAILVDPDEPAPPSDPKAIKRFVRAAESLGLEPEVITRSDYSYLPEYDGLFIRATTSVTNMTYRFARKAWADGLVVIDDPQSILRCTNKVYLAELLERHKIPTPQSIVIHKDNWERIPSELGFPVILKQPDSSFSMGVVKVSDSGSLKTTLEEFLNGSDFVVAQRYTPTDYDWRIGILNQKPLFACKYFMARGHWQIYNWQAPSGHRSGKWETLALENTPPEIVKIALKAANLIGDGFYGVDLKMTENGPMIIEINDNPSIESDVEDLVLKDQLYAQIMGYFAWRIQLKKGSVNGI
ncbi:RimK family protein [Spirochaeta lutea]|uniref:Glutathione synthase n=1 Tax=Spirochaeta lutea TaxID=1480694 RepID=A0A098QZW5_9SPIO|nr:RimK family protein [Spirochaeta lutea]KGE73410.1 glutathione synthase [Spirochaeta lutea]